VTTHASNFFIKFSNDTTGLITNNEETAYRDEVRVLAEWDQENNLSLTFNKTKELIVDFRRLGSTTASTSRDRSGKGEKLQVPRRTHH
jgi:hypothetical protein